MVIDYQALSKGPMSGPLSLAGTPKLILPPASQAAPMTPAAASAPQETSAFPAPQEFAAYGRTDSGTSQLNTDELLNRKLDELREAREANKLKDSEIAMLKKEAAWMKQSLRQRTEEVKAMKANKTAARSVPKKKSAEAYTTR